MRSTFTVCLILLVLITGCASLENSIDKLLGTDEEDTADQLAWDGMDAYESGKYRKAIDKFQKIKDFYPFSKYAILAELKIADAHYQREEYEEAIFEYENFERLHPRNEAVPYVIYQIGRCYFDQINTTDRDQTSTRKALQAFQRLQKQFPDDQYARRSEEHISIALKSLAGHTYRIGLFYYKTKHYKAALHRFMSIISDYPDVGYHQQAIEYIARCEAEIAEEKAE